MNVMFSGLWELDEGASNELEDTRGCEPDDDQHLVANGILNKEQVAPWAPRGGSE